MMRDMLDKGENEKWKWKPEYRNDTKVQGQCFLSQSVLVLVGWSFICEQWDCTQTTSKSATSTKHPHHTSIPLINRNSLIMFEEGGNSLIFRCRDCCDELRLVWLVGGYELVSIHRKTSALIFVNENKLRPTGRYPTPNPVAHGSDTKVRFS